jgi:hypothetical protein
MSTPAPDGDLFYWGYEPITSFDAGFLLSTVQNPDLPITFLRIVTISGVL